MLIFGEILHSLHKKLDESLKKVRLDEQLQNAGALYAKTERFYQRERSGLHFFALRHAKLGRFLIERAEKIQVDHAGEYLHQLRLLVEKSAEYPVDGLLGVILVDAKRVAD